MVLRKDKVTHCLWV